MSDKKNVPHGIKFLFSGISGMSATCVVQPLDLVKNRMQLSGTKTSTLSVISSTLKNEGILAMYAGLSAGLMRQATYTTTRLGTFTWLLELASKDGPPGFLKTLGCGTIAGCIGAFVGTPAEVALVRMTADGRLPLNERRNYKNVFDALFRIIREEGLFTLWRGAMPTLGRAMVVNAAQLTSYSQSKQALLDSGYFQEGRALHFASAMTSGFVTTVASLPVDIAKTKIQNMKVVDGKPEFKGAIDVLTTVVRQKGPFALWKGFLPYYLRLGPHTVLTFVFFEHMIGAYTNYSRDHVTNKTNAKS